MTTLKDLTDRQLIENILSVFNRATVETHEIASQWYVDAHNSALELASKYQLSLERVSGVIAALSPRNVWTRNLKDADAVLNAVSNGLGVDSIKVCTFNPNKEKAFLIASVPHTDEHDILGILKGPKLQNFYLNIRNPYGDGVTVDTHSHNIALGEYLPLDKSPKLTAKDYARLTSCYTAAAKLVNFSPCQLQAITWCQWRYENGIVNTLTTN